jgi:hypothetical protein
MSSFPCLVRFVPRSGQVRYRLGERLVDRYLEFVAGRCRPNTLRAVAFDLKSFVQGDKITVAGHHVMAAKDSQRHLLNPVLVIQELALVPREQGDGELSQSCRSSGPNKRTDQQGLVDMAHPHLVANEVDDLFCCLHPYEGTADGLQHIASGGEETR